MPSTATTVTSTRLMDAGLISRTDRPCAIEVVGLRKVFGTQVAVDDLSFNVHTGQVTGFLGPNGAGKSTALRLMLGLDAGGGRTTFSGLTYAQLPDPVRHVGAMLESHTFHPTRRARNHLRMLAAASGVTDHRVDEVLDVVGLASVARSSPRSFSLGMLQRLGLAVALLGDPQVLLLDEPANGLDPQGISWLRGFLRAYADQGRTVLVSSHQLAEMAQVADRLVVIGRGRLIADMTVAAFEAQWSSVRSVCVRTPEPERLAEVLTKAGATVVDEDGRLAVTGLTQERVGDLAGQAGLVLHELSGGPAALEAAFLEATSGVQQHPLATGVSA